MIKVRFLLRTPSKIKAFKMLNFSPPSFVVAVFFLRISRNFFTAIKIINNPIREKVIRYFLENGSRDNESLFKCVTRELVSWPLKMCNKCGTNDDKVHLARRFEQLRKEGVLLLRRLPLSKRFRCFWFLKKYL